MESFKMYKLKWKLKSFVNDFKRYILNSSHNIELDMANDTTKDKYGCSEFDLKSLNIFAERCRVYYDCFLPSKPSIKLFFKKENYTEEFIKLNIFQKIVCLMWVFYGSFFPSPVISKIEGECYQSDNWFPVIITSCSQTEGGDYTCNVLLVKNPFHENSLY